MEWGREEQSEKAKEGMRKREEWERERERERGLANQNLCQTNKNKQTSSWGHEEGQERNTTKDPPIVIRN